MLSGLAGLQWCVLSHAETKPLEVISGNRFAVSLWLGTVGGTGCYLPSKVGRYATDLLNWVPINDADRYDAAEQGTNRRSWL